MITTKLSLVCLDARIELGSRLPSRIADFGTDQPAMHPELMGQETEDLVNVSLQYNKELTLTETDR